MRLGSSRLQIIGIDGHRLALTKQDVPDGLDNCFVRPQIPSAPMTAPAFAAPAFYAIQFKTSAPLYSAHHSFRVGVPSDNDVDMIRAHMCSAQCVTGTRTNILNHV